jgi:uroporphyrinogen III methyltransferase/synthase
MNVQPGVVYLVGAGPGDPGLLTRQGAEALGIADVVVFDHLASSKLLDLAPLAARRVCAGKSSGHCILNQDQINGLLVEHAKAGRVVVRLKGGDPFVFGRGAEEADHLRRSGVRFEVIPGVTAGVGVTAYAGIPVTHRAMASAVAFVTGHNDPETDDGRGRLDWQGLAQFPGTLVVYMGVTHLAAICRTLIRHGKDKTTPAAVIESGTLPGQRTTAATLETLPEIAAVVGIKPPALLVVGPVVEWRSRLNWFETLPLFGRRIVVTRPDGGEGGGASSSRLERLGAEVIGVPTVEIRPITDFGPLDDAIDRIGEFDWLVFTSGHGVRFFLSRLLERGRDLRTLGRVRLAAIGPATAEALASFHLLADLVPESSTSEGLTERLKAEARGCKILFARADRGRTLLQEELGKVAEVYQVPVYHNADADSLPPGVVDGIREGSVDWITVTSSAIVTRLHALLPEDARRRIGVDVRLASISPITSAAAAQLGWPVAVEASVHTWDGLIEALIESLHTPRST